MTFALALRLKEVRLEDPTLKLHQLVERWPWLGKYSTPICSCAGITPQKLMQILHVFDEHVQKGSLSMDEFIAQVAEIETQAQESA